MSGGQARSLQDRLAAVQGLALDTALRNVGGNLAVVERVLARFSESYRHGVAEFADVDAGLDHQAMRQACHSLRGACAVIGAADIEADLRQLEATLQRADAGAEIGPSAARLNGRLKAFVGTLELELQR